MSRLEEKDIIPSLRKLLDDINDGKTIVSAYQKSALEQIIEMHENNGSTPMEVYFKLENSLYNGLKDKPIEIKSAMIWGGLNILLDSGFIDWDLMRKMYGEFMSKQMNLR